MGLKRLRFLVLPVGLGLVVINIRAIGMFLGAGGRLTALRDRVEKLERENQVLRSKIAASQSDEYLETEARNKLGWTRPNEKLVLIPESLLLEVKPSTPSALPNWKRWLNLIF